ncbi:MAG: CinA family protein [Planctomycetaceae bacterium]|jgi:nicotinamide-nucleotide amidase|nr:CinA family protein [Planctomycetaceae bacterium]
MILIAEIVSIGDEIALGKILDTNAQWISRQLTELGIRVLYHSTIGDDGVAMLDAFRLAASRADFVIITGGLGPTEDDLTRQTIAEMLKAPLVKDDELLQTIREMFVRRGQIMPESNEIQAYLPQGTQAIPNPHGTAPGIDATFSWFSSPAYFSFPTNFSAEQNDSRKSHQVRLFALPGVPAEMREMWFDTLQPRLAEQFSYGRAIKSRVIHTFGRGESQIEAMLPHLIRRDHDPRVGITASEGVITLRIVADRENESACNAALQPIANVIYERLGDLIFGENDETLQSVVVKELMRRNETLATVEFGTGGLLSYHLSLVSNAISSYRGGLANPSPDIQRNIFGRILFESENYEISDESQKREIIKIAAASRSFLGTDHVLIVGRYPVNRAADEASPVWLTHAYANGNETLTTTQSFPYGMHPAIIDSLFVKRALNLLRLFFLNNRLDSQRNASQ